jgi:RimJ/RimL family protein N-acetyltransferase
VTVREMHPDEYHLRTDYFHRSSDEHLAMMGVDRSRLPPPDRWQAEYEREWARPVRERALLALAWVLDGAVVGFSTADRIVVGAEAFMHLHLIEPTLRGQGLGTGFVTQSASTYFRLLDLEHVYSEPYAYNVAPNRALQRAGFRYVVTHRPEPGPINVPGPTTRWVLERPD